MAPESDRNPRSLDTPRPVVPPASAYPPPASAMVGVRRVPAGASAGDFTPVFVLHAIRQWWKMALPAALVCASVLGGLAYWLTELSYQASAWLRIQDDAPYIAYQTKENFNRFVATQVETIRSPIVLGPILSRREIAEIPEIQKQPTPAEWLGRQITVAPIGQSELFTVSFSSPNPVHAARVVNAVVESYFDVRGKEDNRQVQRVIELLEQERERRAQEVNLLRENVRELTRQATGKDPYVAKAESKTPPSHPLTDLQSRLAAAEVEREILAAQVKASEELVAQRRIEIPEATLDRAVAARPEVATIDALIAAKRAQLQEYASKLAGGNDNELCRQLSAQLAEEDRRRTQLCEQIRKEVRAELEGAALAQQKDQVAALRSKLESQQLLERLLRERCKTQVEEVQQLSGETLELEFKRGELARAEQVFELIADRIVKLQTEQRAPSRVVLLKQADVPTAPVQLVPYKKVALASFAGLCLPLALAVFLERLIRRVSYAEQIEEQLRIPVLAEVARLPVRRSHPQRPRSRRWERELALFEESVENLRTQLLFSEPLRTMRVLVITSAAKHEGKTSLSVKLATSIASFSGQQTLLIDADMRSPDIHRILGVRQEPGLSELLARECVLEQALVTDWSSDVHVLPAGRLRGNPHNLVGQGGLAALLEQLREKYRYVIVDTPPVLAASEALAFAQTADASLVCARQDVSRVDQIRKTHERLLAVGCRWVGVVLNGVSARRYAFYYGRYDNSRN